MKCLSSVRVCSTCTSAIIGSMCIDCSTSGMKFVLVLAKHFSKWLGAYALPNNMPLLWRRPSFRSGYARAVVGAGSCTLIQARISWVSQWENWLRRLGEGGTCIVARDRLDTWFLTRCMHTIWCCMKRNGRKSFLLQCYLIHNCVASWAVGSAIGSLGLVLLQAFYRRPLVFFCRQVTSLLWSVHPLGRGWLLYYSILVLPLATINYI